MCAILLRKIWPFPVVSAVTESLIIFYFESVRSVVLFSNQLKMFGKIKRACYADMVVTKIDTKYGSSVCKVNKGRKLKSYLKTTVSRSSTKKVLKNSEKFIIKHLSCEFCEVFKSSFFTDSPLHLFFTGDYFSLLLL